MNRKLLTADQIPAAVTVPGGVKGFDTNPKVLKRNQVYLFNTTVTLPVVGSETRGCDEFAHTRLLVAVEGKTLSVLAENCTY